tara:strand:+ start:933 stop:1040 length:108 start_codon:yes stop_codon:yes gene_type:complete
MKKLIEWWEIWLVAMITTNTVVNCARWYLDRKRKK